MTTKKRQKRETPNAKTAKRPARKTVSRKSFKDLSPDTRAASNIKGGEIPDVIVGSGPGAPGGHVKQR